MKKANFTSFIWMALIFLTISTPVGAQILPCGSCGPSGAAFHLTMQPVTITNNPSGNVISAEFEVFFTNTFFLDLNLVTIPFVIGFNTTNVPSVTDIDALAFPSVWDQGCVFPNNCRIEFPLTPISKTFPTAGGNFYDMSYKMDHTGLGSTPEHPVQTLPIGSTTRIMTVSMTFDGTQAFQITNASAPDFLIRPENFFVFWGDCQDPDPNISNQWGFENQFGTQLLINCFTSENIPASATLPLELIDFSGEVEDRYNKLFWTTLSEQNTEWHIIERSGNPIEENFVEIGRTPAAGTTPSQLNYTMVDEEPLFLSYYRLKTLDLDGSVQYSNIILLKRDKEENGLSDVLVFPNPTEDQVTVKLELRGLTDVTLEVVDVLGRLLDTRFYPEVEGLFKRELSFEHYPAGTYFVQIDDGAGLNVAKVIKQ